MAILQKQFQNIKLVIIDECSMVGKGMLTAIDKRLKIAAGNNLPFGGFAMLFVGDFQQLPPVADASIWKQPNVAGSCMQTDAFTLYRNIFKKAVTLTQSERARGDPDFAAFLKRCQNGEITKEDWSKLQQRNTNRYHVSMKTDEWKFASRIFYDNENVSKYNISCLKNVEADIVKIKAVNEPADSRKYSSATAFGLQNDIYIAKGARVMITNNLDVKAGINNGARGIVHSVIYKNGAAPGTMPLAVIVQMDEVSVKLTESILPEVPRCVPVMPFTAAWSDGKDTAYKRTQIPLSLIMLGYNNT